MPDAEFRKFLRCSARDVRSHPTDVERALWWRLRDRRLGGLKFRRQRPEGRYVADFVCLEAKLIVELDGAQHEGSIADQDRTEDLARIGFDVSYGEIDPDVFGEELEREDYADVDRIAVVGLVAVKR